MQVNPPKGKKVREAMKICKSREKHLGER